MDPQTAQQQYLIHSALSGHYERLKMANANNPAAYYKYGELQYYHKSRAYYYRQFFMAPLSYTMSV
jgi:hypothetical protein